MANIISDETIEYVGILAKLELNEEEKEQAKKDMGSMLDYIDKLNELDTEGVEPMSHVFPVNNVFREDVVTNGDGTKQTLANAPEQKDDSFVVGIQETNGNDIVISTENNIFIRFSAEDVRPMGRNATGVKAINLADGDSVRAMIICEPTDKTIKTSIGELTITKQGRGGKGKRYGS